MLEYWHRQEKRKRLFESEIDAEKPEQKRLAGKLVIVGGHEGAFFAVAAAAEEAMRLGVGEVVTVLPESLRGKVPEGDGVCFLEAEASGGFARGAWRGLTEMAKTADLALIVGDLGKNTETAEFLREFLREYEGEVVLARDAIDRMMDDVADWASRENLTICLTMRQLQKMTQALYYPRMVTLTTPVNQLVETLHKMTLSLGMTVVTLSGGQILVARNGEVISTTIAETAWTPITLWGGQFLARGATLRIWNRGVGAEKIWSRAVL
ncbi:hypothetical protein IKF15_02530 [Candidatus Saccharibacteria bacterium]|nr:hypothetical protein [Candidatus Saccharibacteria bacterium]